nr:hypothetical transcript [Hymenolepis microstoma]
MGYSASPTQRKKARWISFNCVEDIQPYKDAFGGVSVSLLENKFWFLGDFTSAISRASNPAELLNSLIRRKTKLTEVKPNHAISQYYF